MGETGFDGGGEEERPGGVGLDGLKMGSSSSSSEPGAKAWGALYGAAAGGAMGAAGRLGAIGPLGACGAAVRAAGFGA